MSAIGEKSVRTIIETFPAWNYQLIDNVQLFYKLKLTEESLSIWFNIQVCGPNEIKVCCNNHIISVDEIEAKVGSSLQPINEARLSSIIACLDTITAMPDPFNYVIRNFNTNFAAKYPKTCAVCRFCFCNDNGSNFVAITLELMQNFRSLTKIGLSLDTQLPSRACRRCVQAINEAVGVRDMAAKSEKMLIKYHVSERSKTKEGNEGYVSEDDEGSVDNDNDEPEPCDDGQMLVDALEEVDVPISNEEFVDDDTNEDAIDDSAFGTDDQLSGDEKKSMLISQTERELDGYNIFRNANGKMEYWCTKCNHSYSKKVTLDYHFKHAAAHNSINKSSYQCPECGASFFDEVNIRRHMKQVHDCDRTPCEFCGKEFNEYYMKEHIKRHKGDWKMHQCEVCSKTFHANFLLQDHLRKVHTGETPFECHHCGDLFSTKKDLGTHTLNHHPEHVNNFLCNNCGSRFISKQGLTAHDKVCGSRTLIDLKPTDSRPSSSRKASFALPAEVFSCRFCNKKLADQKKLEQHEQKHTKQELSFRCEECNLFFSRRDNLNAHVMAVHTKEFKHFCQHCGRGFISNAAKMSHERTHTQERPYRCSICDKAFFRSHALRQHVEAAHRNQRYQCKFCFEVGVIKELRKLVSIVKHVQTAHAERSIIGAVNYAEMLVEDVGNLIKETEIKNVDVT